MASDIALILEQNPILFWVGIVIAAGVFLITRYLNSQEVERDVPQPTTLDKIVKPKIREHLRSRGERPEIDVVFKIGRNPKGIVDRYVDTELPSKLINPNPNQPSDAEDSEKEEVRIVSIKPENFFERLLERLLTITKGGEASRRIYIFRKDSFVDTLNNNEMIVDGQVMSYTFAGMEVELDNSARNVVNRATQDVVSEKLLAALPNYTEKVDYLFPLHSQNVTMEKQKADREGDW